MTTTGHTTSSISLFGVYCVSSGHKTRLDTPGTSPITGKILGGMTETAALQEKKRWELLGANNVTVECVEVVRL